jgi:organic hydroperoxide reductase OsmC/OhrA
MKLHTYQIRTNWTGNDGVGTVSYQGYRRDHTVTAEGRPDILASSDPSFRGNPARYNPEELLVASLSSCHMLWYLHLCSVNNVVVLSYTDAAIGDMQENPDGSGQFLRVLLRPEVKITAESDPGKALSLHEAAHKLCFIARSVNFPVEAEPEISLSNPNEASSRNDPNHLHH